MSRNFVLRAAERGYTRLVSTGPNASYVAGHPDGVITRHSSFNFHEYQSGIAGFGRMRVFGDEEFTGNGTGYNMHPHHNFIIIAVVLAGTLTHINTVGKIDALKAGDYYVFSAGAGGKHSELNIEAEPMKAIYIWALPDRLMTPPSYHRSRLAPEASANRIRCLVGNTSEALPIRQDMSLHRLTSAVGRSYVHPTKPERGVYAFVVEGAAEIAGTRLDRRDSIGRTGVDRLEIKSLGDDTDLLVVDTAL